MFPGADDHHSSSVALNRSTFSGGRFGSIPMGIGHLRPDRNYHAWSSCGLADAGQKRVGVGQGHAFSPPGFGLASLS